MKPDDFERRLQRQPLRQVPAAWRGEILQAARVAASQGPTPDASARRSMAEGARPSWLSTLFWPNPKAWGALAAVWVMIFATNLWLRDKPASVAQTLAPPPQEVIVALEQQRRLFAELIGQSSAPDAVPQNPFLPRPRSERRNELLMA
jgi:hypothetical protein